MEKEYEIRIIGKVESRVAKRHLGYLLFAIQDSLKIEEQNKEKEESV